MGWKANEQQEMKYRTLTVNGCLGEQGTVADDGLIVIIDQEEANITANVVCTEF